MNTNDIAKAIVIETATAMHIARGMIEEAETAARAEMRAKDYTLCRHCQAGLVNFLIATPDADHETIQAETECLWETCGACSEEYNAHLDRQVEQHAYACLGDGAGHCLNGDDHRWQNGGVK